MNSFAQAQLADVFPETRRRYARCLKKFSYGSPAQADEVRRRRQTQTEEVLRVYPCQDCGLWHLTHRPLTAAEIVAEEAAFRREAWVYRQEYRALCAMTRPYRRGHVPQLRSLAQLDADFQQSWARYLRCTDLWLAANQRVWAIHRANAAGAREVRRIDREALRIIAKKQDLMEQDRQARDALYGQHREALVWKMNTLVRLPSYDWRAGRASGDHIRVGV